MNSIGKWTENQRLSRSIANAPRGMFIGGQWITAAQETETIPVIDPSTGQEVGLIARGRAVDVDRAVHAARSAFDNGKWRTLNGSARAQLMLKLADLIESNADELALLETIDGGKPIKMSKLVDVLGAVAKLRYASGWATRIFGETLEPAQSGSFHTFTVREPVGVAALIVPWNFPLIMAVSKMSEALAAGCTVVIKPAEQTSLATLRLGELVAEAGFPEGVVNIVTGYGREAGQALAEHPFVDKLSFTGSTAVGKALMQICSGNLKRLTLELGGKSPAMVFADADFDATVTAVLRNFSYNAGQNCAAGSRVYVQQDIYEKFVNELSARAKSLKIGPGIDPDTQLGPLISEGQLERVSGYIESGIADGAKVITGGGRVGSKGYFIEPTILANTNASMSVRREEIFGPVVAVTPFEERDLDAIAREANNTDYGLCAYVYTRDLSTAHRMVRLIKAGTVRVNGAGIDYTLPFGGYKQSGWGRENGVEGVHAYTELKSVIMAI
jgi:phenylacetaldehyde dehydrogenase